MSTETLNAKIQELVDAQKANSDAVAAEITRVEGVIAELKALPEDTSSQETALQSVIDGLKATTVQAVAEQAAQETAST